ncbi:MAG: DUF5925 domain-containing protein [Solirubrobacteraceae bacterium MAG38_C4-C5]|nr:DUF5925 domain-containing protein [Candidatus Siliceabacter maunaloa]
MERNASGPGLDRVAITWDLRGGSAWIGGAVFTGAAMRAGLRHQRKVALAVGDLSLAAVRPLGDVVLAQEGFGHDFSVVLAVDEDSLVHVSACDGQGHLWLATRTADLLDTLAASLADCLRAPAPPQDSVVLSLWSQDYGRPNKTRRRIPAQPWTALRENYAAGSARALDDLVAATQPGAGGLLLWHGAPGTGKTHALRTLAREWSAWCDVHVLLDPETFLGDGAGYLVSALRDDGEARDRWRLFVLEDAGELLGVDARQRSGAHAVSRLLNLTDGLTGLGLKALVLVTTNDPLVQLHPAVARPGRTWAQVEFGPLPAPEARDWLAARGADARVEGAATLAELYALARGEALDAPAKVGFA